VVFRGCVISEGAGYAGEGIQDVISRGTDQDYKIASGF